MTTEPIKGFQDFTGKEAEKREWIRSVLVDIFRRYGFEPAETPIIEAREFVEGENTDDEAVSDIYRLTDRGERDLALRYEFTFQLQRLMQNKKLPYKRFQIGPVFRDEPVKGNRLRQFVQCDADIVGARVQDEAELLAIATRVMDALGIDAEIYVNNRALLNEILEKASVSDENREEVIRIIDKLDKQPESVIRQELDKYGASEVLDIFNGDEASFEQYENYARIQELKTYCSAYGISFTFLPSLARGLSYYNGMVLEIKTTEMKETITAGGSYLFNGVQSTGISFGLDRLASLVPAVPETAQKYLVLSLGQDKEAITLAETLRSRGKTVEVSMAKVRKAMEYADSKDLSYVVFLGEEEVSRGNVKIRDMSSGGEETLSREDFLAQL